MLARRDAGSINIVLNIVVVRLRRQVERYLVFTGFASDDLKSVALCSLQGYVRSKGFTQSSAGMDFVEVSWDGCIPVVVQRSVWSYGLLFIPEDN